MLIKNLGNGRTIVKRQVCKAPWLYLSHLPLYLFINLINNIKSPRFSSTLATIFRDFLLNLKNFKKKVFLPLSYYNDYDFIYKILNLILPMHYSSNNDY